MFILSEQIQIQIFSFWNVKWKYILGYRYSFFGLSEYRQSRPKMSCAKNNILVYSTQCWQPR